MKLQTLKEGLALMGASLSVTKDSVMIDFQGVAIIIDLSLSADKLKTILFSLNLNIFNWFNLVKESLNEEEGGEL